eukprot:Selendium_serpulae@DN4224_c0_g1_i1.p1
MDPVYDTNVATFDGRPVILGIDEAGRGPVLGPLVYACCYCPRENEPLLVELNINDSKQIKEAERERMDDALRSNKAKFGWRIHSIMPQELSAKMLRKQRLSLNQVSHSSAISLIRHAIAAGVNVTEAFIDTVGNSTTYAAMLSDIFPNISITVAEKADATYKIVGAASILAKVERYGC